MASPMIRAETPKWTQLYLSCLMSSITSSTLPSTFLPRSFAFSPNTWILVSATSSRCLTSAFISLIFPVEVLELATLLSFWTVFLSYLVSTFGGNGRSLSSGLIIPFGDFDLVWSAGMLSTGGVKSF